MDGWGDGMSKVCVCVCGESDSNSSRVSRGLGGENGHSLSQKPFLVHLDLGSFGDSWFSCGRSWSGGCSTSTSGAGSATFATPTFRRAIRSKYTKSQSIR